MLCVQDIIALTSKEGYYCPKDHRDIIHTNSPTPLRPHHRIWLLRHPIIYTCLWDNIDSLRDAQLPTHVVIISLFIMGRIRERSCWIWAAVRHRTRASLARRHQRHGRLRVSIRWIRICRTRHACIAIRLRRMSLQRGRGRTRSWWIIRKLQPCPTIAAPSSCFRILSLDYGAKEACVSYARRRRRHHRPGFFVCIRCAQDELAACLVTFPAELP